MMKGIALFHCDNYFLCLPTVEEGQGSQSDQEAAVALGLEVLYALWWAPLVTQWKRTCLPMQETWVPSLIWENAAEQLSPCAATTEPVFWSLGTTTTEPTCHNY